MPERGGEVAIAHGIGRDAVDGTRKRFSVEEKLDCPDHVRHGYPAHPVPSVAEPPPATELEREEHPLERATVWSEHDSSAWGHDANPGLRCRLRGCFPCR